MLIKDKIYNEIVMNCPKAPPETGGILGGYGDSIMYYSFDNFYNNEYDRYKPNISLINDTIKQWGNDGISFLGMFHSHFPDGMELSYADKKYILKIMLSIPDTVQRLFFPIVFPKERMISYVAERANNKVHILNDVIDLF